MLVYYLCTIVLTFSYFLFLFKVKKVCGPLYCTNNCGSYYTGRWKYASLRKHLQYECGVPKKFSCFICFKQFSRKTQLQSHCGMVHKTILPQRK